MTPIQHKLRGIRDSLPGGFVLGRASSGNGPPELIRLSDLARSPQVAGSIQQIVQDTVSVPSLNVLANDTAGTAPAAGITVTQLIDMLTGTANTAAGRGSILFRGASAWALLAPGASGQVLTANGPSTDPTWQTSAGGSGTPVIPLSLGTEPGQIVTDGAGNFIVIPFNGN